MNTPDQREQVRLITDGACRGNPGPGGWGAVLRYGAVEKLLWGGESQTTNNRMELTAVIRGLEALKRKCKVVIITDSRYVEQGITEWLAGWKRSGWRTAARQPVKNRDLWESLEQLVGQHQVSWQWVKGHAGHPDNELADRLANRGIDEILAGAQVR